MSIRNLNALFRPSTIALIGASNQAGSVGSVLARNLLESGFAGPILPVNPNQRAIRSTLNYRSIGELPLTPDLAVIATPPAPVPGLIAELGASGCRAAVVITAGFGEGERAEGEALKQAMLDAAKPHLLRIVGPNCLGVMSTPMSINASFAHISPKPGRIAFLTQSGAVATAMLDWASARDIGFSHLVSLGSMSDVDFGDLLDYLALDANTDAILLYVEAITHARKFLSAARMASRTKPVVVVKSGRTEAGAKAALSHTGALAGSDAVYEAAFRRAGMLRVRTLAELFQAVGVLATGMHIEGDRLGILTNGGGLGVLAVDEIAEGNGQLAPLADDTIKRLDAVLPATWSRANPVDILGDAPGHRYRESLLALLEAPECDAVLVMNCPTAVADSRDAARAVVAAIGDRRSPVLTCWLGEGTAADARRLFAGARIPSFATPEEAVRAFGHLVGHRRNQSLLLETPPATPSGAADLSKAEAIIDGALSEGRALLTEIEAKDLLASMDIPTVPSTRAADPAEAMQQAERLGYPVVLKILSRDISHKSDVGGVQLNLASQAAVRQAAEDMLRKVREAAPQARIDGFTIQPMIRRPGAHELLLGVAEDRVFGPVVLFGHGGTAVEVVRDRVVGIPPLNLVLARDMMQRTEIFRLLRGYRDRPAADLEAIALTLVRLSQLVTWLDRIVELDINPLLADAAGVIALDARIVVRQRGKTRRLLAIRPYPHELETAIETKNGRRFHVRPILPEDETRLVELLNRSTADDVRLRFFAPVKKFGHRFAARMTQIDYDREMALVAIDPDSQAVAGVVRLISDPDNEKAEFAVMVRSDLKGIGLGYSLMIQVVQYARKRSVGRVYGDVLSENTTMLQMARELGFAVARSAADPDVVTVTLDLQRAPASN